MAQFQPARLEDFHFHHRRFRTLFAPEGPGDRLWSIINSPEAWYEMVVVNERLDLPAVSPLSKELWQFIEPVAENKDERRSVATAIGGMVRTVMVANGFETTGIKRGVPPVMVNGKRTRVFRSGEVYRRAN